MRPCPLIAASLLVLACDKAEPTSSTPPPSAASQTKTDAKAETKLEPETTAQDTERPAPREQGQPIEPPPGLAVPVLAESLDPVPEGPVVYVSRNILQFDGETLVALRDGELDPSAVKGHAIPLLYQRLSAHVEQAKQAATGGGEEWEGPLVVVADTSVPYSTVLDVLYTAGRTGVRRYAFVAQSEPSVHGSIPVAPPLFDAGPPPAEPKAEALMVVIDPAGFEVRDQEQPTAAPERIGVRAAKDQDAWDYEALGRRAQQYRSTHATARSAAVSPAEDTPHGVVLRSFAALRGSECAAREEACVLPELVVLSPGATSHSSTRKFDPAAAEAAIAAALKEKEADGAAPASLGTGSAGAGFGGRGKAVPEVRQAVAEVTGSLEPDIVRRIVRAHINEVRSCYNGALGRNPAAEGRLEVSFSVTASGSVEGAKVASSTLADDDLGKCVLKAVGRWKFPKPADGKVVEVRYPFVLSPG